MSDDGKTIEVFASSKRRRLYFFSELSVNMIYGLYSNFYPYTSPSGFLLLIATKISCVLELFDNFVIILKSAKRLHFCPY